MFLVVLFFKDWYLICVFSSWSFGILLYEMLSFGEPPYANIEEADAVIEFVNSGQRLSKPEMANDDMYLILFIYF